MMGNYDQTVQLRVMAANVRSAAAEAGHAERVALLRSAEGFEWVAEAMEHAAAEDVDNGSHADEPRR
jgi:hypothetical protein